MLIEWISVDEKLPNKTGLYIVTLSWTNKGEVKSNTGFSVWHKPSGHKEPTWCCIRKHKAVPYNDSVKVIAWMPFPEKYIPKED